MWHHMISLIYVNIGTGNDLPPVCYHAITCTNINYQLDLQGPFAIRFESKQAYEHFH